MMASLEHLLNDLDQPLRTSDIDAGQVLWFCGKRIIIGL